MLVQWWGTLCYRGPTTRTFWTSPFRIRHSKGPYRTFHLCTSWVQQSSYLRRFLMETSCVFSTGHWRPLPCLYNHHLQLIPPPVNKLCVFLGLDLPINKIRCNSLWFAWFSHLASYCRRFPKEGHVFLAARFEFPSKMFQRQLLPNYFPSTLAIKRRRQQIRLSFLCFFDTLIAQKLKISFLFHRWLSFAISAPVRNSSKQAIQDYPHQIRLETSIRQIWLSRWDPSHKQGNLIDMYIQR